MDRLPLPDSAPPAASPPGTSVPAAPSGVPSESPSGDVVAPPAPPGPPTLGEPVPPGAAPPPFYTAAPRPPDGNGVSPIDDPDCYPPFDPGLSIQGDRQWCIPPPPPGVHRLFACMVPEPLGGGLDIEALTASNDFETYTTGGGEAAIRSRPLILEPGDIVEFFNTCGDLYTTARIVAVSGGEPAAVTACQTTISQGYAVPAGPGRAPGGAVVSLVAWADPDGALRLDMSRQLDGPGPPC